MTQYAIVSTGTGEILALVDRDEPPVDGERDYHEVSPPVLGFPDAPFPEATWTWGANGPFWHDPRPPEQKASDARAARDALLLACDWMVTRAFETSTAVPAPWAAYRQALRDWPSAPGWPDIETPTPPES